MVSGKYSVLSGAISREQTIANLASNLANVHTTGYKRSLVSFESILEGEQQKYSAKGINFSRIKQNYTDFSPGGLRSTENPLDLALQDQGFFKVQGDNGVLYTRRGDFVVDQQGVLRTSNGQAVLNDANGLIVIQDTDIGKIAVAEDGGMFLLTPDGNRTQVATLGLTDIDDTTKLVREENTCFSLAEGGLEIPLTDPQVVQGSLEISNVNMTEEMARLIDSYRTFETYHKVIQTYSQLSETQDELGTVA